MAQFTMYLIRTVEGVRRDVEDWDFGLVNFGYEACEESNPVTLTAPRYRRSETGSSAPMEPACPARLCAECARGLLDCQPDR
jgi:hypothetical protein